MSPESYRLVLRRTARKELLSLPPKIVDQLERAIGRLMARLQEGERPQDIKPIRGRPGTYRIHSGEYRVLFELDDAEGVVTVFRVGPRKDVYRNL